MILDAIAEDLAQGPALGPVWRQMETLGSIASELECYLKWIGMGLAIAMLCGACVYNWYLRDPDDE